jgi:hypothetical protein
MQWTAAAEAAHGEATDAVQMDVERRYGLQAALRAEDHAMFIIEWHAEDLAREDARRSGSAPLVTPEHVAVAAAAYSYRPSFSVRLSAVAGRISRALGVAARTA